MVPEIPILHQISPTLASGQFCSLIETEFKAISFINTVNVVRKKHGLKSIQPDNNLCNVALLHGYDQFVSNPLTIYNTLINIAVKVFYNFLSTMKHILYFRQITQSTKYAPYIVGRILE